MQYKKNYTKWTEEEKMRLVKEVRRCRHESGQIDWKQVQKAFPNRSVCQCHSMFSNQLPNSANVKPNKKWSEDDNLLLTIVIWGIGFKWKVVQLLFKERTKEQIRQNYLYLCKTKYKVIELLKCDPIPQQVQSIIVNVLQTVEKTPESAMIVAKIMKKLESQ